MTMMTPGSFCSNLKSYLWVKIQYSNTKQVCLSFYYDFYKTKLKSANSPSENLIKFSVIYRIYMKSHLYLHENYEQNPLFLTLFKLENAAKFEKFTNETKSMIVKLSNLLDMQTHSFECIYDLKRIISLIQITWVFF